VTKLIRRMCVPAVSEPVKDFVVNTCQSPVDVTDWFAAKTAAPSRVMLNVVVPE
jgi:hypothetical protein